MLSRDKGLEPQIHIAYMKPIVYRIVWWKGVGGDGGEDLDLT